MRCSAIDDEAGINGDDQRAFVERRDVIVRCGRGKEGEEGEGWFLTAWRRRLSRGLGSGPLAHSLRQS